MKVAPETIDVAVEAKKITLLAELPGTLFADLMARAVRVHLERDRPILVAGQTAPQVPILLAGLAKVARGRVVADLVRGPCLALPSAALGLGPAAATVTAVRPCELALVERTAFLTATTSTPASALRLSEAISREACGYLDHLAELAEGSVDERLAALLERLAESHGSPLDDGRYMALPLRRSELAQMINATTETVSRTLAGWERQGFLRSNRAGMWWSLKRMRDAGVSQPSRAKSERPEI